MKKLLFLSSVLIATTLQAKNYYISQTGNNSNNGLTSGTAWQTIAKLNASSGSFAAGDSILFKRGDTFYGSIKVGKAGLNFGAYGSGAKPIITGLSTVTGWVNVGSNIWEAPTTNVKPATNLVLRNSNIQQVGRYPNANAASSGYLTYTASTTTSVTGPALSSTTNWTGAEVAVRSARWEIKRRTVTAHSGGVVSFSNIGTTPKVNYGYFFQRDARTLDQDGEWYYNNSTKKLRVYSTANPSTYTYQVATVDSLFISTYGSLSISNIEFYGAGEYGIAISACSGVTIINCDVNYSGGYGISEWFCSNVVVDGSTTNYCLGSGIRLRSAATGTANVTVKNCTVKNTAMIAGMETSDVSSSGNGILAYGGQNVTVTNNIIKNSGYNAIQWAGDNVTIQNNFIDSFCSVRDDGGGIYTYTAKGTVSTTVGVNRNILSNIILHGIGAPDGANKTDLSPNGILSRKSANGIYCDEGTWNVRIEGNTVGYIPYHGLTGNGNGNLTIRNNTIFSTSFSHSWQRLSDEIPITGLIIKKNIFYPYRLRFRDQAVNTPTACTQNAAVQRMGTLDSNYYSTKGGADSSLDVQTAPTYSENHRSFSYIKSTLAMEPNSVNYANTGTLEYNASNKAIVVNFAGLSKKDVYGNVYNNSVTIPAWSSKVLIPNGTVTSSNIAPAANAGTNKTITLPVNNTSLTGSGTDTDGTISTYAWTKISGPASGTIATTNAATTAVNSLVQGVYKYQLTVTDNNGATGRDTVQVTVNAAANQAPAANAGNNKTITLPVNNTSLTGSGTDTDGTISTYAWTKISGPSSGTIATANAATTAVNSLVQGVYKYQLTVTDNNGATGRDTVQVTVNAAANKAPAANAGNNKTITLPVNNTSLTGSGTDTDGTISTYAWTKISGPSSGTIATANAATTAVNSLVQGVYQYQLTVTDNNGATGRDTVKVTVNAAANQAPQANAGADNQVTLPINTTTLTGSGKDTDGTISAYAWVKISGPASGTIATANAATTAVNSLVQGVYQYQLTVTDNNGATGKDTVQVTVNAANEEPQVKDTLVSTSKRPGINSNEFKVFPNPVRNIANLNITTVEHYTKLAVSVVDLSGKIVKYKTLVNLKNKTQYQLDMSDLRNGYYIITVRFDDGLLLSSKVLLYGGN